MNNTQIYYIIGAAVLLIILLVIFLLVKTNKKPKEQALDQEYLDTLLRALGNNKNLLKVSIENKRIRLILKDVKAVDAKALQNLEIPAFLKSNELKILIKDRPKDVYQYLAERSKTNE